MVVAPGMPVPVTLMPTYSPPVSGTVIRFDPFTVLHTFVPTVAPTAEAANMPAIRSVATSVELTAPAVADQNRGALAAPRRLRTGT